MDNIYDLIRPNPWTPQGHGHIETQQGNQRDGMKDLYSRIRQNYKPGQNDGRANAKFPNIGR